MAQAVNKLVTYQLQVDTSQFDASIRNAIDALSTVEGKLKSLTALTAAQKNTKGVAKTRNVTASLAKGITSEQLLSNVGLSGTTLTKEQLLLLDQTVVALDTLGKQIDKVNTKGQIGKKATEKIRKEMTAMNKSLKDAGINVKKLAKNTDEASTKSINSWDKLFSKVSMITVLYKVFDILTKGFNNMMDYAETVNLFNVATKNASESFKGFVEDMEEAYSLDPDVLYKTVSIFRQYAEVLGATADEADIISEGLTKLTYDLASLYNVGTSSMASALKSGLAGLTKPLMQYGVSVHKATIEQLALDIGFKKSWAEMSEQEKVYLRYLAIIKQTTSAQGDLSRTLESPRNQFNILQAQLKIFVRNLGAFAIVIGKTVVPMLNGMFVALNKMMEVFNEAIGFAIEDYTAQAAVNTAYEDGTTAVEDYEDALHNLKAPLDEINQANNTDETQAGTVDQTILDALETYNNLMYTASSSVSEFKEIFESIFSADVAGNIGKTIGEAIKGIITVINTLLTVIQAVAPVLNKIFEAISKIVKIASTVVTSIITTISNAIEWLTKNIWLLISAFAALNVVQLLATGSLKEMAAVKIVLWLKAEATAIWQTVAAWVAKTAQQIKNNVASLAQLVLGKQLYSQIFKNTTIQNVSTVSQATNTAAVAQNTAAKAAGNVVVAANTATTAANTVSTSTNTAVKNANAWALWSNITATAASTAATIKNTFVTVRNTIAQWWHNASLAAKITLISMGAGLLVVAAAMAAAAAMSNNNSNKLSTMATGGVVNTPTLTLVGEGRYPEAVVPLGRSPQFTSMKQSIADEVYSRMSRSNVGSSSSNQPIIITIDGKEFGRAVLKNVEKVQGQVRGTIYGK